MIPKIFNPATTNGYGGVILSQLTNDFWSDPGIIAIDAINTPKKA